MKILVLDDSPDCIEFILGIPAIKGNFIFTVNIGEDALSIISFENFDIIFLDIDNGSNSGAMEVIGEVREIAPETKIVVMSENVEHQAIQNPKEFGFDDALHKGLHFEREFTEIIFALGGDK